MSSITSQRQSVGRRRFAPKTRTGCVTCRARRIKCGEEKPFCSRCIKGNHTCRYEPDKTKYFVSRHFDRRSSSVEEASGSEVALLQPLSPVYGTAEETHYLDTFLKLTAPWLAKYNDESFFFKLLPQRSWYHPALRHSLVALAIASETARSPHAGATNTKHHWHYNQALKHVYSARGTDEDVVLLTSAMFWLHDNVTSSSNTAMVHLQGFLRILTERKIRRAQNRWSQSDFESHLLRGLVFSADVADDAFAETLEPDLMRCIRDRLRDPKYTRRFKTMDGVRDELRLGLTAIPYSSRISHLNEGDSKDCDASSPISATELRTYFERWYRAFNSVPTISPNDRILLECHYIIVALSLQVHQIGLSSDPASSVNDPQSIRRMEYVLNRLEEIDTATIQQAPMSSDVELPIIPILSQMIVLTNDSNIRSRAFGYLRKLKRVEGLWSTDVVADMMWVSHPPGGSGDLSAMLGGTGPKLGTIINASLEHSSDSLNQTSTPGSSRDGEYENRILQVDAAKALELRARTSRNAKFDASSILPMRSLNEKISSRLVRMQSSSSSPASDHDSDEALAM